MAETLGSLLDKLAILKVREWHTENPDVWERLHVQAIDLKNEIDRYVHDATTGSIPVSKLLCPAFKQGTSRNGNPVVIRDIGGFFCDLAQVNCEIWHDVERSRQPIDTMNREGWALLVKRLATLNLERNGYKESIDDTFAELCKS